MANADIHFDHRRDWILANPWLWAFPGAILCALAWASAAAGLGEGMRWVLILLGLFLVAIAVTVRLSSKQLSWLDLLPSETRSLIFMGLCGLCGLASLAITVCVFVSALGLSEVLSRTGQLVVLWVLIAPLTACAARQCLRNASGDPSFSGRDEAGALFLLAAVAVFCAARGLDNPDDPSDWDTIRFFIAVFAAVCLVASPLLLVTQSLRRIFISLIVIVHFGGICTAALSASPSPVIIQHMWIRIYRPYLQFMYLNNAYHFYAPEPGPASYFWFRLYYTDADDKTQAEWYKVPKVDERGWQQHTVALEYQRILAVTENATKSDPSPQVIYTNPVNGQLEFTAQYLRRLANSDQAAKQPVILGKSPPKREFAIPFHPQIPHPQQQMPPNLETQRLLESYARFVCRLPHPDHPDWKIQKVRVYKVTHLIIPVPQFFWGMDPREPETYQPVYLGEYDPEGNLLDTESPFLYWILPILREDRDHPEIVRDYASLHAGDPNWQRSVEFTHYKRLTQK